jgi:hypothetical protein
MHRPKLAIQFAAALTLGALLLSGCGGGSSSTAASGAADSSTGATTASSAEPVTAADNTVTYSSALFEKMSSVAIEPNCQSPAAYLSASYSGADFSCSLTLDRVSLFSEVCASQDPALIFTNDPEAGTCSMTSDDPVSVKAGCDAIVGDSTVTAAFDDATVSCILTVKPEAIINQACDPATVDPLESKIDGSGLTCTLTLSAPVVYEIIAQAVTSGDILCDDGSPRNSPSEACVIAALEKVNAKP